MPGSQGRDVDSLLGKHLIDVGAQLLALIGFEGALVVSLVHGQDDELHCGEDPCVVSFVSVGNSASNTSRTASVASKSSSGNNSTMHAQSGSRVPAASSAASLAMPLRQFVVGLSAMERTVPRRSDSKTRLHEGTSAWEAWVFWKQSVH